jgi:hypothetical protein
MEDMHIHILFVIYKAIGLTGQGDDSLNLHRKGTEIVKALIFG